MWYDMAVTDWNKITIQDDDRSFWVKYRNSKNKREIHIANQSFGTKYYVETAWLTHKYKLFDTKNQALIFAKGLMKHDGKIKDVV